MIDQDKVLAVMKDVTDDPDVQAGYPDANGNTNVTWCNRALFRMLTRLNGDADLITNPKGIGWTSANAMVMNARDKLAKVPSGTEAQMLADHGELIMVGYFNKAGGSGHVALVAPDPGKYSDSRGPKIGQAGRKCGIMYTNEGFGLLYPREVEFFKVPFVSDRQAG